MRKANILALSRNTQWNRRLRQEAAALAVPVTAATSPFQAVSMLTGNHPAFSHFLLDPAAAEASLPILLRLSAEAASSTPRLILRDGRLLGVELRQLVPHATIADCADGWLARALAAPVRPRLDALTADEIRPLLIGTGLQMRYQPIVRLADRKLIGIEALARLEHPTRGTLPPSDFVPQLEASGDGWALTERVIDLSFAEWGDLRLDEFKLTLSLNLPLDVLLRPGLCAWLAAVCASADVPPARLLLELTETQIVVDPTVLREPMQALRALGVGLAIDDIAPVTHEPAALLNLPFTMLKLDKRAVREAADCSSTRNFIRDSCALGQAAKMEIVAEGVEDMAIWAHMHDLGADHAQGFYIARPLPASAMSLWIRNWSMRI